MGPLFTAAWHVLGLQMEANQRRLAVNILNKQKRTNDKGWSSSGGGEANNPSQ
jgi:hypothetical protein